MRPQPDFVADSSQLGLAYMVHHILQCALREEIILPPGIDCIAANRFVETVFRGASRLFREPNVKANAADRLAIVMRGLWE